MERGKNKRSFDEFLDDLKEAAIAYSRQPNNTISSNTTSPPPYTSMTSNTNTSTMMPYTLSKTEEEVQQPWPEASYPPLGAWEDLYTHTFDEKFNWVDLRHDVDDYDEAMKSSTYSDLIVDFDMMLEKSRCFDNSSFFSSSSSSTLPPSMSTFSTPPHHSSSISGIQLPTHSLSSFSNSSSPDPICIDKKSQLVIHASSSSSSLCHPPIYVEKKCMASLVSSCSVVVEHEKHPKRGNQKGPKKDVPKFMIVTRSPQVDVLEDGFRWRKYGQKSLKNNIYPRSYYKCTKKTCHAQKRVQRCGVDNVYVLTAYLGKHSHPTNLSLISTHLCGYKTSLTCD